MKTFKRFQEELIPIKKILDKLGKKIKNLPGDKPYTQEPGQPPKQV